MTPTTTNLEGVLADAARAHKLMAEEVWNARHPGGHAPTVSAAARAMVARRVVYLTLRLNGFSLHQVGAMMGRHHTTVMYHLGLVTAADRALAEVLSLKWAGRVAA